MQAFTTHTGLVAPMDKVNANVDIDAIFPKQSLKCIGKSEDPNWIFMDVRELN